MRTLSSTLLAAQKAPRGTPYIKVEAKDRIAGLVRLDWSRLYTGSEDDYFHGVTIPGDGSLVRTRITLPADSRKLYRQRVASPGPLSDYSSWTYANELDCVVVAVASQGSEVSIVWLKSNKDIRRIKSTDNGATWGNTEIVGTTPTSAIYGVAAAYKPNGDLAIFYADASTLYVKKHVGGSWQSSSGWGKSTGDLSGVAAVYDGDWNLLVTGKDTGGNFKLWSLVYGDGGDVAAGTWSSLRELASAPSGGDFEYGAPFVAKPDEHRAFYVEKFAGSQSYDRPFWSYTVPGFDYTDSLWREPVPFNLSSEYGLAIAHSGSYCWLTDPAGVWRAQLTEQSLDVTGDVVAAELETRPGGGGVTVELRNDTGQYASPGSGTLAVLHTGCRLEVSLGYVTTSGNESSAGPAFQLESYEHVSAGGKASLVLHAVDGWRLLAAWQARHQFRWNKSASDLAVKDLLAFVLGRAGIKLTVNSQSSVATGYYPDFTISPGRRGDEIVRRLLSFVPDVIFIEGDTAYLVNPQTSDSSAYSYGSAHVIFEGNYLNAAWGVNRVRVEGYDTAGAAPILVDSYDWTEIDRIEDRLALVEDQNIGTVAEAGARGSAHLREADIASFGGTLIVPPNCGQQLYDVIDISDPRAGLSTAKRRVVGIVIGYRPDLGDYRQRLSLADV